ncbi:hypothetical protein KDH_41180 [Dictyobacter sp. S3.2.2.5]|uniref:Uncharacterized protein n=1 Tax=Dictyobacter halimunensis TaxID=3026934 RepID=A0ABQ6FSR1_9CHLR|nr:hypothetical protein KDH_41180 [Dictyobacter sp. S3.2.2.5]
MLGHIVPHQFLSPPSPREVQEGAQPSCRGLGFPTIPTFLPPREVQEGAQPSCRGLGVSPTNSFPLPPRSRRGIM